MWKRIKQWAYWMTVVGLYMTMSPDLALACERCFGASVDSPTTQGIQLAMLTLLGSVGLAGSGIVMFFFNMTKRSQMLGPGETVVTAEGDLLVPPEAGHA